MAFLLAILPNLFPKLLMTSIKTDQNTSKCIKTRQNALKHIKTCKNASERIIFMNSKPNWLMPNIFPKLFMTSIKTGQKTSKRIKTYQDVSKCIKTHHFYEFKT